MKKLIRMVDFVLLGWNDIAILRNYANFLKQPLELWMFVPCELVDGVWVVLKEPNKNDTKYQADCEFDYFDEINYKKDLQEYQQAREKCLFDGFKSVPFSNSVRKGNYIIDFNYTENINIESLLHHDIVFELTPTAQKQIGL